MKTRDNSPSQQYGPDPVGRHQLLGDVRTENIVREVHSALTEDDIDHRNKHSVAEWVSSVFDDRDDVRSMCCHVDEVTARPISLLQSRVHQKRPRLIRDYL